MRPVAQTAVRAPVTPVSAPVLQRKCACGTHTQGGGECGNCAKSPLQAKLSVGAADDPFEREADRVADQVLSRRTDVGVIRRLTGAGATAAVAEPAGVGRILASSGAPLEAGVRRTMEQGFGRDFSAVRVHSDAASAQQLNARAYTVGNDIVFDAGQYAPATGEGQRLLAHELTHVVQQGGGRASQRIQRDAYHDDAGAGGPGHPVPHKINRTPPITTNTVATTPANRTRTTLGLGEEVDCTINPSANATWSVTGGGSIGAAAGPSARFTASQSPSTPTVKASVGGQDSFINFNVIAPTGLNSTVKGNPSAGTKGPPNNNIGFHTDFDCTVLPDTVSFYRAEFRENKPLNTWTWPDGSGGTNGPQVVPWNVTQANKTTDNVTSALRPIGLIKKAGAFVDFSYTIAVPEDYKDAAGTWVTWLPGEQHVKSFKGATQQGQATLVATNSSSGSLQGPWQ